jgi:hypothetical protein
VKTNFADSATAVRVDEKPPNIVVEFKHLGTNQCLDRDKRVKRRRKTITLCNPPRTGIVVGNHSKPGHSNLHNITAPNVSSRAFRSPYSSSKC